MNLEQLIRSMSFGSFVCAAIIVLAFVVVFCTLVFSAFLGFAKFNDSMLQMKERRENWRRMDSQNSASRAPLYSEQSAWTGSAMPHLSVERVASKNPQKNTLWSQFFSSKLGRAIEVSIVLVAIFTIVC